MFYERIKYFAVNLITTGNYLMKLPAASSGVSVITDGLTRRLKYSRLKGRGICVTEG
jgi:hypothetical protein